MGGQYAGERAYSLRRVKESRDSETRAWAGVTGHKWLKRRADAWTSHFVGKRGLA
jgi:hypothetical protein